MENPGRQSDDLSDFNWIRVANDAEMASRPRGAAVDADQPRLQELLRYVIIHFMYMSAAVNCRLLLLKCAARCGVYAITLLQGSIEEAVITGRTRWR